MTSSHLRAAHIPYGLYWSTPFARWQGAFSHLHSLQFAAWCTRQELDRRGLADLRADFGVLGTTVPQKGSFYGWPWVAGLAGLPQLAGPTISQACATSARCVALAADAVRTGDAECVLVVTADRVSNGPQLYHPDPAGPGGHGSHEAWVLDNFGRDPYAGLSMLQTAENVARRYGISRAEQDEVTLLRYEQYAQALAEDRAFQRRYMRLPFEVPDRALRRTVATLAGDEGVHAGDRAALERLEPVLEGGTITHGGQTHPADGNAGLLVTSAARARELSPRPDIAVRILAVGQARTEKGFMPMAIVPAAADALRKSGLRAGDIDQVKTHNPFVLGDIVLARETGIDLGRMNRHGCSLVWGHPQGPTGLRALIELVEGLAQAGGGNGLFTGCAAGDTAMAVVVCVEEGRP